MLKKKKIMAYVHQLLDQPSQWQTSQQAGPGLVPNFTSTSITVKQLLIKNNKISQSKSSLLFMNITWGKSIIIDKVNKLLWISDKI